MIKEGFAIIGDSFVNVATFFKRVITKKIYHTVKSCIIVTGNL